MKKVDIDLIPNTENPTPDYYCTWQTQLYATSGGTPKMQRDIVGERQIFGKDKPYGWAYFYEKARADLLFVMDDSWDVPYENEDKYYGSLILDKAKFPESTADGVSNAEALKRLTDRIKSLGWKGLGGWVCAQEATAISEGKDACEYWIERLKDADAAGFSYWKVDWGKKEKEVEFRRMLTELGRKYAPSLIIEHAMTKEIIPFSDVYRTYDVPAIMSIPLTMEKVATFSKVGVTEKGYMGLVNCEDEAYVAAAGGFPMGIMRHIYRGEFPDGQPDRSFPSVHRDIKSKTYEVIRAARWHRIAPAFGIDAESTYISDESISDSWRFEDSNAEIEQWWFKQGMIADFMDGDILTKTAPAAISRGCALPTVAPDENGNIPYVIASKNPNGVFSVATLGRTQDRSYFLPRCDVSIDTVDSDTIGIFGEYKNIIMNTSFEAIERVLIQDLAADSAYDITEDVSFCCGRLTLSGELVRSICNEAQPVSDTSESGVVLKIVARN